MSYTSTDFFEHARKTQLEIHNTKKIIILKEFSKKRKKNIEINK